MWYLKINTVGAVIENANKDSVHWIVKTRAINPERGLKLSIAMHDTKPME